MSLPPTLSVGYLPGDTRDGISPMSGSELLRAGQGVMVRVICWSESDCGLAFRELRRHVRAQAAFGAFLERVVDPMPVIAPGAGRTLWVASLEGATWRTAGNEYTANDLARAIRRVVPDTRVDVWAVGSSIGHSIREQYDTRADGSVADVVGGGAEALGETAGDLVEGLGNAGKGLGDLAAGAGEGAQSVGGFLRDWPLLALVAVVGIVVAVRRGVL